MVILSAWDNYHDPEYFIKHILYWCFSILPNNHENCQFQSENTKYIPTRYFLSRHLGLLKPPRTFLTRHLFIDGHLLPSEMEWVE